MTKSLSSAALIAKKKPKKTIQATIILKNPMGLITNIKYCGES
jgi:hypothetical protein